MKEEKTSPFIWGFGFIMVCLLIGGGWWYWNTYMKKDKKKGCVDCQNEGKKNEPQNLPLLPLMDPAFNLRECAKQSILLEDHLNNSRKHCRDCIRKHFLTMEALAEEASGLDNGEKYSHLTNGLAEYIRKCEKAYLDGGDECEIAQRLRKVRKPLMIETFDKF